MSPSSIRNRTGRKRIRCRFRSINAQAVQERFEFSRIGNRKGLPKSHDGCYSQWRSGNKSWSNSVCQWIRLFRESKTSRRYTGSSLAWITLRKSRIFLWVDQWSETHNSWTMADEYSAARKTTYRSLSLIYRPVLPAQLHIHHQHRYHRTLFVSALRPATIRSESTCSQARGDLSPEPIKPKTQIKMKTPSRHGETCCVICQSGWNNAQEILWTKEFQYTRTHPRALLVSQLQSRWEKWYRASTVFILTSRSTETATFARRPRWGGLLAENALAWVLPIGLDWSIFSTVSCTVESLTLVHWRTLAGRPRS